MDIATTLYDGYDLEKLSPEEQIVLVFEERGWGLFPDRGESDKLRRVYRDQGHDEALKLEALAAMDEVFRRGREVVRVEQGVRYLVFPRAYDERPQTVKALVHNQFETRRFPFFVDLKQDPDNPIGYVPMGAYLIDSLHYTGKAIELSIDAELMRYMNMAAPKKSIEISAQYIPNLLKTINLACRGKDNMMIAENFYAKYGAKMELLAIGRENLVH